MRVKRGAVSEVIQTFKSDSRQVSTKCDRARRGFTMMELLTVIAIIGVTMSIAFVSFAQIQKDMQQRELDGTAKELFIVAQNHLSSSDAQGMLARLSTLDKADKEIVGNPVNGESDVFYFVVGDAGGVDGVSTYSLLDSNKSVLGQMLPYGSIDDSVRKGGTYVIKYNLKSATVLDVFYARSKQKTLFAANTDDYSFTISDYAVLFNGDTYIGTGNKNRQKYPTSNGDIIIGWYGGANAGKAVDGTLDKPILRLDNAERLTATVTNPNTGSKFGPDGLAVTLRLIITGKTSGASTYVTLIDGGKVNSSYPSYVTSHTSTGSKFVICLDDVTESGQHFYEIFGGAGFVPGEDITVQAIASSSAKLTNVAKSSKQRRNSLFASLDTATAGGPTVKIANIRHLENLSANVSNFAPGNDAWKGNQPTKAEQTSDLSWTDFRLEVFLAKAEDESNGLGLNMGTLEASGLGAQALQAAAAEERTTTLAGADPGVKAGSFMPITPAYGLEYNGKSHKVSNLIVDKASGNVGLFGYLNGAEIKDVMLVNSSINTDAGDAGALTGSANNTKILRALACNETETGDDSGYTITGTGSVGGLVGSMTDSSAKGCAAAVYVRGTNAAGGLVGAAGTTDIAYSYAGGHTSGGAYSGSPYSSNVYSSAGNAGGLVGLLSPGSTVSNCYSTCSTSGSTAAGLVAVNDSSTVSDCYAVGAVTGGTAYGLVGGAVTSGYWIETVNGTEEWVAVDAKGNVSSLAKDAYDANMAGKSLAVPYDGTLVGKYGGRYSYRAIVDFPGYEAALESAGDSPLTRQLSAHYGDWTAAVSLVVNL